MNFVLCTSTTLRTGTYNPSGSTSVLTNSDASLVFTSNDGFLDFVWSSSADQVFRTNVQNVSIRNMLSTKTTSIQADIPRGVFTLQFNPTGVALSDPFQQPCLVQKASLGCKQPGVFNVLTGTDVYTPVFSLDLKNDLSSNVMWITSFDNNITSFDKTTGQIDMTINDPDISLPSTLAVSPVDGSVFVRCVSSSSGLESIAKYTDGVKDYLYEVTGAMTGTAMKSSYLANTFSFPSSKTMRYDHIGGILYWISADGKSLHSLDNMTNHVALPLSGSQKALSVDIDLASGNLFFLMQNVSTYSINRVVSLAGGIADSMVVPACSDFAILQNQSLTAVPFYFSGQASTGSSSDTFPATFRGTPASLFEPTNAGFSSPAVSAGQTYGSPYGLPGTLPQAYEGPPMSSTSNDTDAFVWSRSKYGAKSIKIGASDSNAERWHPVDPETIVNLPRFSWQTQQIQDIEQMAVLQSDDTFSLVTLGAKPSFSNLATVLTGITGLFNAGNTVFVASDAGTAMLDWRGELEDCFAELRIFDRSPDGRLWAASLDNTEIMALNPDGTKTTVAVGDNILDMRWSETILRLIIVTTNAVYLSDGTSIKNVFYSGSDIQQASYTDNLLIMTTNAASSNSIGLVLLDIDSLTSGSVYIDASLISIPSGGRVLQSDGLLLVETPGTGSFSYSSSNIDGWSSFDSKTLVLTSEVVDFSMSALTGYAVLTTLDGKIFSWDGTNVTLLLDLKKPATMSSNVKQTQASYTGDAVQSGARVMVGSSKGTADRWDSGQVFTSLQGMLYGGGDNLVPGQKYYVGIQIQTSSGWSEIQWTSFVVPK